MYLIKIFIAGENHPIDTSFMTNSKSVQHMGLAMKEYCKDRFKHFNIKSVRVDNGEYIFDVLVRGAESPLRYSLMYQALAKI